MQGVAHQAQGRARVAGPAAEAGGDRQGLVEQDPDRRLGSSSLGQQRAGGAQDEVVALPRQLVGKGAMDAHRQHVGVLQRQAIADVGEDHQAAQRVVAVGARRADMQE